MKKREGNLKNISIRVSIVLNVVLLICIIAYVFWGQKISNGNSISVQSQSYTQEEANEAMEKADNEMTSIYSMLIAGTSGDIGEYSVSFGIDGSFNGFYDNDNINVSGYTYEIVDATENDSSDVAANINIYDNDGSYVQYKLKFDSSSNLELYYPASNLTVQLN